MGHRIPTAKETMLAQIANKKLPKETFIHEIYPYICTSDRQRAYLVKHGIKHFRKDGEYR